MTCYCLAAVSVSFAALGITPCSQASEPVSAERIDAASMRRIGTVDERFQSYNIEMIEVIGGRFWKPYRDIDPLLKGGSPAHNRKRIRQPVGMNPNLYQQRPPIDLANLRLHKLAAALGPAYVRVTGTWVNSAYFHNSDQLAPKRPPKGFSGVLTRRQWKIAQRRQQGVGQLAHTSERFETDPLVQMQTGGIRE